MAYREDPYVQGETIGCAIHKNVGEDLFVVIVDSVFIGGLYGVGMMGDLRTNSIGVAVRVVPAYPDCPKVLPLRVVRGGTLVRKRGM